MDASELEKKRLKPKEQPQSAQTERFHSQLMEMPQREVQPQYCIFTAVSAFSVASC